MKREKTKKTAPSSPEHSPDPLIEETAAAGKILQLLAFLLSDEEYGIDIRMVKEIIRLTEITPVPRAPSYIQGIISLRGTVLPIFDLRQLLSMPDTKPDKKSRILVVSLEAGLIGIIVDAVTEVVDLDEAELEPPPTVMTNLEADHIKGLGRYKGRLIILLDLEKVYRARHDQVKSVHG
jgi:purine-binding chemotaxis protein CheW